MSLPGVVRELSGVYHRLFDHSPAVHGEVRMFLLEFEDRRGDEFPGMLQTLMTLNEAKDVEVDKLISTDSMGRIVSKLDSLSHSVEKLIEMGQERLKIEPQVDNEEWRQFEASFISQSLTISPIPLYYRLISPGNKMKSRLNIRSSWKG